MKIEEIKEVLAELHKITGFRISLHDASHREIAAYPKEKGAFCKRLQEDPAEYEKCVMCDKEASRAALAKKGTHIYTCRYGLIEAVSPLYNFGILTGFLMMGQVFEADGSGKRLGQGAELIRALGKGFSECTDDVPNVNSDMIESYVKIMTICAQYLTLSNAIPSEKRTTAEMARIYILNNFHRKISIEDICREVGCSKSSLTASFKKQYGTTVAAFIRDVRLEEAQRMLSEGKSNMNEIAIECGFADQSYFSKVFSAAFGTPPSKYGE